MGTFIKTTAQPPAAIDVKVIAYHDYCPTQQVVGQTSRSLSSQGSTSQTKGASASAESGGSVACRVTPSESQSKTVPFYAINGDSFPYSEIFALSTLVICEEIPDPEEKSSTVKEKGEAAKIVKKEDLRRFAVLRPKAIWGPKTEKEFDSDDRFAGIDEFYPTYKAFNMPYNLGDIITIRCLEQPKEMVYSNFGKIKLILEQYECYIPNPDNKNEITFFYEDVNSAGRKLKSLGAGPVGKVGVLGDPRQILFNDAVTKGEKGVMGAAEHFYYYDNPAPVAVIDGTSVQGPRCAIG
jgi:hypothetical protein